MYFYIKNKIIGSTFLFFLLMNTNIAFSQTLSLKNIVNYIVAAIGGTLIPLVLTLLFLYFLYNIFKYLSELSKEGKTDPELHQKRIIFPIIIMFIVFGLYGIIEILRTLIGG